MMATAVLSEQLMPKVNFSPNTFRVHEAKDAPPPNGVLDGLIPGDQTVIVRCDGYAACEVPVPGLKPNETRSIVAKLGHGVRLVGRIVTGANKKPVPRAKIVLIPGAAEDEEQFFVRDEDDIDAKSGESDAQGRFSFEGLATGPWTLRVNGGTQLAIKQTVVVSKEKEGDEIEVQVPAFGYLVGRLVGPEGTSFNGLSILVQPSAKDQEQDIHKAADFFVSRRDLEVPVAANGTFRAGPVPAGECEVSMCMPPIEIPSGENGSMTTEGMAVSLGVVTLVPDTDTDREFDVRATFPGSVSVRLRVNGVPAPSVIVRIEAEVEGQTAAVISLDARGEGKSGPIPLGTYRLISGPVDSGWVHQAGPTQITRPGEDVAVQIEVQLLHGVLRVIDQETGTPLAKAQVSLTIDGVQAFPPSAIATTDDQGRATLELPPGRYRVEAGGFPGFAPAESRVIVDWTSSGPTPPEVRVTPFEFPK